MKRHVLTVLGLAAAAALTAGIVGATDSGADRSDGSAAPRGPAAVIAMADEPHAHDHPHPPAAQGKPATPVVTGGSPAPVNVKELPVKPPDPAAAAGLPPPAGGVMEITELVHDAGTVERGAKVTHEFKIKNTGTGDLAINAKPG